MKLRKTMCATCPFREGVPKKYAELRTALGMSALSQASRICHSTGKDNAFHRDTGKPEALCRGARNLQLHYLAAIGFLSAPTDEAWNTKCAEMGIQPNSCK
jgi:hypothetical protein